MKTSNAIAKKPKFSVAIQTDTYKKLINQTLSDPARAQRFIASISSAVAVNAELQTCDAGTILSGALLGESLRLSPSPQLGQYYLIPFSCKVKDEKGNYIYLKDENGNYLKDSNGKWIPLKENKAQFVLGYKGYIQLALRSGNYKKLNVLEIKAGELVKWDPLNEEIEVNLLDGNIDRDEVETIGYYAMFEYVNGFRKALYWSKEKMEKHAEKYSPGYKAKKGYTFWEKDFDSMAKKTMLRQLISKWGIMSIEMQQAFEGDMGVIHEDKTIEYVDNNDDLPITIEQNDPLTISEPVEMPMPEIHPMQEEVVVNTNSKQVKLSDLE